jgi:hypothetical protein
MVTLTNMDAWIAVSIFAMRPLQLARRTAHLIGR